MSAHPTQPGQFDVLTLPLLGRFIRWRHASTVLRLPLFALALLMIFHGLTGPQLSPKNLATVLTWLHLRGLMVLGLVLVGNLFCLACPFVLARRLGRRFLRLERAWPRPLRNKWLAAALFALILFAYELFDLWGSPWWTAWLILAYLAGALTLGVVFRDSPFCKYVCPLGQFNLVSSMVSPLEVKVRDLQICQTCPDKDCIQGRGGCEDCAEPGLRGCELGLFQPRKVGNLDCNWRLDCLRACPYDNVGVMARLPASELWLSAWRSGIGRLSERTDLAALVVMYTFGALINAFGMVSPVYELEQWLADRMGTTSEAPVLGLIFLVGLVLVPLALLGLAAWFTPRGEEGSANARGDRAPLHGVPGAIEGRPYRQIVTRYAYSLVPMGLGVWAAHFAFHFLTGVLTVVPLMQSTLADWGRPRWDLGPIVPTAWLFPIELGMLGLGCFGSLLVAYRLAEQDQPDRLWRTWLPWAVLNTLIFVAAIWLMAQPMEMRGTFLEG